MPIKILIVEDDDQKLERVKSGLADYVVGADLEIETSRTAIAAKRKLRQQHYDLLILDVALPLRTTDEVDPKGGINLLREVLDRAVYQKPAYVIGLTARQDIYQSSSEEFAEDLWSLVFFDFSSDEWLGKIERKILHIASQHEVKDASGGYDVDLCVVAALQDEIGPFLSNGWEWERCDMAGDATIYYKATVTLSNGRPFSIVCARSAAMGMAAASALTTKAGMSFKPRFILMLGICAGDPDQTQFGDLIVASPAWDYGNGKHFVEKDGQELFEASVEQINLTADMRGAIERVAERTDAVRNIHSEFAGEKPRGEPKVIIGPLASGAAVVANRAKFELLQSQQHRKLLGIEMEAYGVMLAAQELPHPKPKALIMKAVQDYANNEKDDRFRKYACHVSAAFAELLIEELSALEV